MPLISALRRHRQADFCEFEDSLVYRVSFRIARATQRNLVSKSRTQQQQQHQRSVCKAFLVWSGGFQKVRGRLSHTLPGPEVEYYTAMKNEILSFVATQMDLGSQFKCVIH